MDIIYKNEKEIERENKRKDGWLWLKEFENFEEKTTEKWIICVKSLLGGGIRVCGKELKVSASSCGSCMAHNGCYSLRWVAGERFTHVEWWVHVCGLVPICIFLGLLIKQTFLDEVFIADALPSTSPCLGFLRMAMMNFWMHFLFLYSRMSIHIEFKCKVSWSMAVIAWNWQYVVEWWSDIQLFNLPTFCTIYVTIIW